MFLFDDREGRRPRLPLRRGEFWWRCDDFPNRVVVTASFQGAHHQMNALVYCCAVEFGESRSGRGFRVEETTNSAIEVDPAEHCPVFVPDE